MTNSTTTDVRSRAESWLTDTFDPKTQEAVREMINSDPDALEECFYADLEFGTGGMRGKMGVGTNRVNRYTIGLATQGFADYLLEAHGDKASVAIAYDSRNNSPEFAQVAADVLSANGIKVYLFEALRPTPELSFAVRLKKCKGGIVITASHNPPEYNGYKVYGEDGGQVVPPADGQIISKVRSASFSDVKFDGNDDLIEMIGAEVDEAYIKMIEDQVIDRDVIRDNSHLNIVFTSLHGTGVTVLPDALKRVGFENVNLVPQQDIPDGNFPTVESPNPEEAQALEMGLRMCEELKADILLGTDPDADRVGLAIPDGEGKYILLNGNQSGALLVYYHLMRSKEKGMLKGNEFVAKTVVTTDLIQKIADDFGVNVETTLTGFKWIAEKIRQLEGQQRFVTGGEESYGYLIGDAVRDKDAVLSAVSFCEIAAWAKGRGQSLKEVLAEIYSKYGLFLEKLISLKKEGIHGKQEIGRMMEELRKDPPSVLAGSPVVQMIDHQDQTEKDMRNGHERSTGLPKSNVLQFLTEDGSKVTARPSGTEPKIKFYFSVNTSLDGGSIDSATERLENKIDQLIDDLDLG